ncbi:MAG: ligase-associated DNA damage response exonuclease, partial [Chitinophagales bacterium]|nr:ligase-associated DNA damage response exonuclease [Hyphomicrobiales bacterium]
MKHPSEWLAVRPEGLYCIPGAFYIDPTRAVDQAVVTHGHADHARSGHARVVATPQTIDIMACRYGENFTAIRAPLPYGETVDIGGVKATLHPAGHITGSAQILLEYSGARVVISGDYKRRVDPTAAPFEPIQCDVFVTEATFGLPVFRHPPIEAEIAKLLTSLATFPGATHLVGVYALGKCQRLIMELRRAGYDKPIYLHGALVKLTELYAGFGLDMGDVRPIGHMNKKELAGEIVLAPPSAVADRWSRALPDMIPAAASGWMQIRARAKQARVELPLIISDHCDWDELLESINDT